LGGGWGGGQGLPSLQNDMAEKIRALGLFSGGLDSMLAAALLKAQGLEVTLLCFVTPFYGADRARESAAHLGLPLMVLELTEKFWPLIFTPPHGFGRGHNPCIDCHLLMIREAGRLMAAQGFHFIFSGEVLGQRPMSQNRGSLNLIAKESGLGDLLLRPLSAKLLKTTRPEQLGWVDRERLLNLSGRGRKSQMALAAAYDITRYPAPAGGCLLTDPGYAARLKELLECKGGGVTRQDLDLLKWGRHFRLPGGAKAVVGRTQKENEALLALQGAGDLVLMVDDYPGPLVLVSGQASEGDLAEAAGLAAAYSDAPTGAPIQVAVPGGAPGRLIRLGAPPKDRFKERLI
jgi:tRNA-specific 2-thiouridylase